MTRLLAQEGSLESASASSASTAATVAAGAAASAIPQTAVTPGTMSPMVVMGAARAVAHGMNKALVTAAGSAMVAALAEKYGEDGTGYTVTDLGNATRLL